MKYKRWKFYFLLIIPYLPGIVRIKFQASIFSEMKSTFPGTHGSFVTLLRVNDWLEVWIVVCFEVSENVVKLLPGEIILSRFHQHFTSGFCANFLSTKCYKTELPSISSTFFCARFSYEILAPKITKLKHLLCNFMVPKYWQKM